MRLLWNIKDLVEVAKKRQENEFDVCIVVSGSRGNGKSSFIYKFLTRLGKFKPWKQQVYSRKDVITLLENQKFGNIFDDEAIRTGYKRNFFDEDQKILIQMLNMYRDNFNIYCAAVPDFYSLDKDLRALIKIHIHIIERGLGVVHLANEGTLYSDDCWDIAYNKKIEENWAKRKNMNPNYQPKYNRLTTFAGYIKFKDLTPNQRAKYKEIKLVKRKEVYDREISNEDVQVGFYDRILDRLIKGEIKTKKVLQEICLSHGFNYSAVTRTINAKLTDRGMKETLKDFLRKPRKKKGRVKIEEDA